MRRPKEITTKLKKTDVELQNYVSELEKEIQRLQKNNAKLQVQNVSQQAEITGLKKVKPNPKNITLRVVHDNKPPSRK